MKHLFKKIGLSATALALLTIGLNAQNLTSTPNPPGASDYTNFTATGTRENIDSVTVGSRMPYKVEAQTAPTGLTLTFEYKWLFDPSLTVQDLGGTNLTPATGTSYYSATEISVVMPASPTTVTLTSNVRNLFNGAVLCEASDVNNTIRVLPRPTISWTANTVATCGAATVTIPVTLTGFSDFEVYYTITYWANFDKSDSPSPTPSAVKYATITNSGTASFDIPSTEFSATGLYEITVTNITDRISRKSLDMSLVAAQSTDLPTGVYTVLNVPAPTAQPVQHIKNVQ